MKKQLSMFAPPNEDPAKISSLIRSESSHELGLTLAKANNYNHVELLIDLIYYNFHLMGDGCCDHFNYRYYKLFEIKIENTKKDLDTLIYLHENIKLTIEIQEQKYFDLDGIKIPY